MRFRSTGLGFYGRMIVASACLLSFDPAKILALDPPVKTSEKHPKRGTSVAVKGSDRSSIVVDGNTRFALDLYGRLKSRPGNLFFSPYSISTALAMTAVGARGESLAEMVKTLHLPVDSKIRDETFHALTGKLNADSNADGPEKTETLRVANALWGRQGGRFLPAFLETTEADYGAGLHEVDFQADTEAARSKINDWIAERTNGKIKELLPPSSVTPRTSLILTNAIYFLGRWADPFAESATQLDTAFQTPSKVVKVPMMARQGTYLYSDALGFQAVELLYQSNDLAMVVFLPKAVDGLDALETSITDRTALQKTIDEMRPVSVKLQFPRFKLTETIELADLLQSLGMRRPFDAVSADFSGISDSERFFLSKVIHKAFVDVDEKGTEAAAATAAVMMKSAAMIRPVEPLVFKADHPFLFVIRERSTGSLLFMGRLVDPLDK